MAFRKIVGSILALAVSLPALADDIKINPSHPDSYVVVKGDTLWDIAGRFLQRPHQWPEIWHVNPQIENPNLIYPGDTLTFSMVDGKPSLTLTRGSMPGSEFSGDQKLYPRIRESEIQQAISLIPSERIAPFLSSPRVVGPDELDQAPYVVDFVGEHLIAGAGDKVYVRAIEEPKTLSYTIFRPGDTFVSPETQEILGYEAKFIANTSLQAAGDPATLLISKSTSEVRMGDRVMTHEEGEFTLNYFPHPPEADIKGSIISVLNGVTQIGRYNVVVIDKGASDGLEIGHVLDIFRRGDIIRDSFSQIKNDAVKLPDEKAGTLMVFRTFERISYALVMEANQAIHVLDKIQTP